MFAWRGWLGWGGLGSGKLVEGGDLITGDGTSEVVHRPAGLENLGGSSVDVVEEELAFFEAGDELVGFTPVEVACGGAFESV